MTFIFILGYPNPRKGALRGGAGGIKGVLSPILPNIICYVKSGAVISGKSENYLHFLFGLNNFLFLLLPFFIQFFSTGCTQEVPKTIAIFD